MFISKLAVLVLLFLATSPQLQDRFASMLPSLNQYSSIVYAVVLFMLYLIVHRVTHSLKEEFFFQVSDNLQKCSGPYVGQATTFEYDAVGSGKCTTQTNPPLGYINPNGTAPMYGGGYFSESPNFPEFNII